LKREFGEVYKWNTSNKWESCLAREKELSLYKFWLEMEGISKGNRSIKNEDKMTCQLSRKIKRGYLVLYLVSLFV